MIRYRGTDYEVRLDSFMKSPMALRVEAKPRNGGASSIKRITFNQGNWAKFNLQMPKFCSFVDIVDCPEAEDFLQETGLAKPLQIHGSDVVRNVGNQWYPLYKFDEQKLRQLDPGGCLRYTNKYEKQHEIEQLRYGMALNKSDFPDTGKVEIDYFQL